MDKKENTIRVLGIDPGLTTTGWSISDISADMSDINVRYYGKIMAINLAKKNNKVELKEYGNIITLLQYETCISALIDKYHPDFISCEDAFYNPRTPNAYLSLKLCIHSISRILHTYGKKLYLVAPTVAKQAVFGKGTANKEAVQNAVKSLKDISFCATQEELDAMVEHEADSIAIAYAFTRNILPDLLLQTKN